MCGFVKRGLSVCALVGALAAHAGAQPPASTTDSQPARADDYYAAGESIQIASPMPGDVVVAGRRIDIAHPVAGDILAAGWWVTLSAPADDDVRIAGRTVTIDAPVRGDLIVAGGNVTVASEAHIAGRSWIAGRIVSIDGILDRDVKVAGGTVRIAGEVRQPLEVVAEQLDILSTARILAPLTYKSPSAARIAEGAVVTGPLTHDRMPAGDTRSAGAFRSLSTLLFSVHLFLAGLLMVVFLPQFEPLVIRTIRGEPGKSLLVGLVGLVVTPFAALVLCISILGIPMGLTLAAFYGIALFLGVLGTAFFVGDAEARLLKAGPLTTRGQHALLLLAGVLTLALLRLVLGGIVVLASVLIGLGALTLWVYQVYRTSRDPVPLAS